MLLRAFDLIRFRTGKWFSGSRAVVFVVNLCTEYHFGRTDFEWSADLTNRHSKLNGQTRVISVHTNQQNCCLFSSRMEIIMEMNNNNNHNAYLRRVFSLFNIINVIYGVIKFLA